MPKSKFRWIVSIFLVLLTPSLVQHHVWGQQNRAAAAANRSMVSSAEVKDAIVDGVNYLKKNQNSDGTWMAWPSEKHGVTALAAFSLLNAGTDPSDPVIRKATSKLKSIDTSTTSTYALSFQTMVLCLEDPKSNLPLIQKNVAWFEDRQFSAASGARAGGWGYNRNGRDQSRPDNSISQVALLALHEAQAAGAKVKPETWQLAKGYWERQQVLRGSGAGGFCYETPGGQRRGAMTCAGISSLIIAMENSLSIDDVLSNGTVQCCGQVDTEGYRVEKAIEWLVKYFIVNGHPIESRGNMVSYPNELYYLYSLERAGRLAGRREFGNHDWYREGARHLVDSRQGKDYWSYFHNGAPRDIEVLQNILGTSFALLFLSKGLRPVVIGKYQHASGDDWNIHRKGVHFLTRSLEKVWQRKLNWQTIDGRRASANDLLEAPILFISGRDSFKLTDEQKENLKEYVNQGGFIFAEACVGEGCDPGKFDAEFTETMEEIFNTQFATLDPSHPIWTAESKLYPNADRPLKGLQACCRTSVVYCPKNLTCFWQLNQPRFQSALQGKNKDEVDYCTQLGINVVTYATNRELRDRLNRPKIESSLVDDVSPDQIEVGKILHSGGADDAAVALQNLMQAAKREASLPFSRRKTLVSVTDKKVYQYPILFMHGRFGFEFSEEERQKLRSMVKDNGFFLFADSICASGKFTESFRKEMLQIFPEGELKRIDANHPIFTKQYGSDIQSVALRTPISDPKPDGQKFRETKTLPYLEAIEINGTLSVIFSPNDLSCALENAKSVECKGYKTDDASRIGINILRYALNREIPDGP